MPQPRGRGRGRKAGLPKDPRRARGLKGFEGVGHQPEVAHARRGRDLADLADLALDLAVADDLAPRAAQPPPAPRHRRRRLRRLRRRRLRRRRRLSPRGALVLFARCDLVIEVALEIGLGRGRQRADLHCALGADQQVRATEQRAAARAVGLGGEGRRGLTLTLALTLTLTVSEVARPRGCSAA